MKAIILSVEGCMVKIRPVLEEDFKEEDIAQEFSKYGSIKQIFLQNEYVIIYFKTQDDARNCSQALISEENFLSEISNADPDSTGDTFTKTSDDLTSKRRKSKVSTVMRMLTPKFEVFKSKTTLYTKEDPFLGSCTSPVLLNTMDPGFRLAYFDNVSSVNGRSNHMNMKSRKLHRFNESIKKYMVNAPDEPGSYEFIITNLPLDVDKQNVYELCGKIEPASVELKTTSNTNVLYASIKTKSQQDFEKLIAVLNNKQINGTKITIIPITKIIRSPPKS